MGLKLNIGSGQRKFDAEYGWTNVDCVSREPDQVPDVVADSRELPFKDESTEICVLHHVVEHFGCGEADGVINECYRVLEPGGRLLVFVPDLKELAGRWLSGQIDDFIFMVNVYGAYQGEEGDRHKWGYDKASLPKYLDNAIKLSSRRPGSWSRVFRFDWRPILGADIARDWWIAGVECVK